MPKMLSVQSLDNLWPCCTSRYLDYAHIMYFVCVQILFKEENKWTFHHSMVCYSKRTTKKLSTNFEKVQSCKENKNCSPIGKGEGSWRGENKDCSFVAKEKKVGEKENVYILNKSFKRRGRLACMQIAL